MVVSGSSRTGPSVAPSVVRELVARDGATIRSDSATMSSEFSLFPTEQHATNTINDINNNNNVDDDDNNTYTNTNNTIMSLSSQLTFNQSLHSFLLARIAEEYQNQTHWFSTKIVVALVVSYCVIITAGFVGNSLVVLVMLRRKDLRTSRNFYILNLSVCDIVMCSVCMPFSLVKYTLKRWMLGPTMCRVVPALATIDVFVSTFTIVAVAVDRYRSIVRACREHGRGSKSHPSPYQVVCILVAIWVVSIAMAAPLFIFHELSIEQVLGKPVFHTCIEIWPHDRFREVYSTFVSLVQYLTPTIVISALHARICSFLQSRIDESPASEAQRQRHLRQWKRYRKNLVLLTAIAASFSLAWLPLTLLNIIADWTHDNSIFGLFGEEQFYLAHAVALLIAMTSSAVNPLLYGWFNTNFRNAFLQVLGRQKDGSLETSSLRAGGQGSGRGRTYDSLQPVGATSCPPSKGP
ncbi:neuropeptide Y receptor type 2-like [Babylonia areolata]|uniref:neuropeptide Y receptor type 2-like n=1 Tax=Babylonia areolata TaxID=304850 RepID=UPI003FD57F67